MILSELARSRCLLDGAVPFDVALIRGYVGLVRYRCMFSSGAYCPALQLPTTYRPCKCHLARSFA
jgi:hypothetical protein